MTRLKLVLLLALAGIAGCAEPEKLDGPHTDPGHDPAPQVAQSATGAAAAVWHMKAAFAAPTEVHFFQYDSVLGWSGPTNLGLGTQPDVALSDSGRAIVVYEGKARVFDGATWGAEETIAPSGVTMPDRHPVALDALGNGMVVFTASSKAWHLEYDVASGWDSPKWLSSAATGEWRDVDMSSNGDVVTAYCEGSNSLIAAFRPAGAGLWSKKVLGANCCHSIGGLSPTSYPIRVSVSETGDAMVIGSNASTQVCAARYDHVTGWGSKVTLQSGVYAEFPSVAMNANGDAIAAWKDIGTQMYLRRYTVGTGWSALMTGPNGLTHGGVGVGINDVANIAAVFTSGPTVFYVVQSPGGTVSSPITISTQPGSAYYLDTASTPLGLGLIGWNQGENLWVSRRE